MKKLNKIQVVKVDEYSLEFENNVTLTSEHEDDCCEQHYLSFKDLTLEDFSGLYFDLSNELFFERIPGYGIALQPIEGFPVRVPGYGYNNGYYSDNLALELFDGTNTTVFAITECQTVSD